MVLSESWGCLLLTYFLEITVPFYRRGQGGSGGGGGGGEWDCWKILNLNADSVGFCCGFTFNLKFCVKTGECSNKR